MACCQLFMYLSISYICPCMFLYVLLGKILCVQVRPFLCTYFPPHHHLVSSIMPSHTIIINQVDSPKLSRCNTIGRALSGQSFPVISSQTSCNVHCLWLQLALLMQQIRQHFIYCNQHEGCSANECVCSTHTLSCFGVFT